MRRIASCAGLFRAHAAAGTRRAVQRAATPEFAARHVPHQTRPTTLFARPPELSSRDPDRITRRPERRAPPPEFFARPAEQARPMRRAFFSARRAIFPTVSAIFPGRRVLVPGEPANFPGHRGYFLRAPSGAARPPGKFPDTPGYLSGRCSSAHGSAHGAPSDSGQHRPQMDFLRDLRWPGILSSTQAGRASRKFQHDGAPFSNMATHQAGGEREPWRVHTTLR